MYSWKGASGYENNRLVETSMVEQYTPPTRTVTIHCEWDGSGATYLSIKGELTLSDGTKFPFLGNKQVYGGTQFIAMDFFVNNVPGYEITSVKLTSVRFNIAPSGDLFAGYLQTYTIHDAINSVVLDLGLYSA